MNSKLADFGSELGAAHGGVTVNFVEPEKFTDMPFNSYDKQRVMEDLKKHFDKLASGLSAGQDLKIDVLDIDLAGRIEPNRTTQDLRILRGHADWPAITLRYNLESQGKSAEALAAYQATLVSRRTPFDAFRDALVSSEEGGDADGREGVF